MTCGNTVFPQVTPRTDFQASVSQGIRTKDGILKTKDEGGARPPLPPPTRRARFASTSDRGSLVTDDQHISIQPTTRAKPQDRNARASRCRLLDRFQDRCANAEIDAGLCAHHLAEAARAFRLITEGISDDHTIATRLERTRPRPAAA